MPLKNPNTKPIQVALNYVPAGPKFEEFHARNSVTIRCIIGAMGGGKTTACLAEVLWLLLCSNKYQGKTAFVIGRDHFQNRTKLLKDIKTILKGDAKLGIPAVPKGAYTINLTPPILVEFWNGSRIMFYSHGTEDQIDGMDASIIFLDEANKVPESMYLVCVNRLGREGVPGKFLIGGNPSGTSGWLYDKFWKNAYDNRTVDDKGNITWGEFPEDSHGVTVALEDNKFTPEHRIKFMKKEYAHSKVAYERAVLGLFASNDGLVYSQFMRDSHVLDKDQRPEITDDWTFSAGLDFGFSPDPTAMVIVGYNPKTMSYYVVSEYKNGKKLLKDHAAVILDKCASFKNRPSIYSDHDAQTRSEYAALGVSTTLATKDIMPGVNHLQTLLSENRLLVFSNCTETIKELEAYSWDERKDVPKANQDDHLLDSLRYALFSINHASSVTLLLPTDYDDYDGDDEQLYPNRIYIGRDRKGNPQYAIINPPKAT